jgi:hypothetical protein
MPRIALAALIYLIPYSLAAYADLWTTVCAISEGGAREGNVFATSGPVYLLTRALLINVVAAVIMTRCVMFSANHAESMDSQWLLRPMAWFGQIYLNPWVVCFGRHRLRYLSAIAFSGSISDQHGTKGEPDNRHRFRGIRERSHT